MTTGNKSLPFVQQGSPITAAGENDIIRELNRLGNMASAGVLSNGAGQFVKRRIPPDDYWEGTLRSFLSAATDYLTGKATALADRIERGTAGQLVQTDVSMSIVNRNPYQSGEPGDVVAGYEIDGEFRVFWIYSEEAIASVSESTATGSECIFSIGGIHLEDDVTISTSPSYVLGLDAEGCLVRIPVAECPAGS